MTSHSKPEVVIWSKLRTHSEKLPKEAKNSVRRLQYWRHIGNRCRWIIFGEIFTTRIARINVLTAHAQTLLSQKSPKMVLRAQNDRVVIGKRVRWIQI